MPTEEVNGLLLLTYGSGHCSLVLREVTLLGTEAKFLDALQ